MSEEGRIRNVACTVTAWCWVAAARAWRLGNKPGLIYVQCFVCHPCSMRKMSVAQPLPRSYFCKCLKACFRCLGKEQGCQGEGSLHFSDAVSFALRLYCTCRPVRGVLLAHQVKINRHCIAAVGSFAPNEAAFLCCLYQIRRLRAEMPGIRKG